MTTIAIVGAGRGLGVAVARKFGAEGFDIADLPQPGTCRRPGRGPHQRGPLGSRVRRQRERHHDHRLRAGPSEPGVGTDRCPPVQSDTAKRVPTPGAGHHSRRPGCGRRVLPVRLGHRCEPGPARHANPRPWNRAVRQRRERCASQRAGRRNVHRLRRGGRLRDHAARRPRVGERTCWPAHHPWRDTPGHPTNSPAVLADTLWGMHTRRDTFRVFTEALDV
jgi:hypothetical protein